MKKLLFILIIFSPILKASSQQQIFQSLYSDIKMKPCDNDICDFYTNYLEKKVECGKGGYAIGYGYKYCSKFDKYKKNYSNYGKLWNDSAMKCLQTKLVNYINLDPYNMPSCEDLERFAFKSHPTCYTQKKYSFCNLRAKDYINILKVIQAKDLLSKKGIKQVLATAKICIKNKLRFKKKNKIKLEFKKKIKALNFLILNITKQLQKNIRKNL
ncbi:MAG: hypothetical protein COB02_18440 [Candidatus Cloacimonadota bacterium]|nr:MAG: hypothetical protein COB02_18440 [Candidatus Cloacimonadota bacterium]